MAGLEMRFGLLWHSYTSGAEGRLVYSFVKLIGRPNWRPQHVRNVCDSCGPMAAVPEAVKTEIQSDRDLPSI